MNRHRRVKDEDADKDNNNLRQRLAALQLPHMPEYLSSNHTTTTSGSSPLPNPVAEASAAVESKDESSVFPTIRILVVADLDLSSAAALAEYTLQQRNQVFDASRIDMCIACGPFARDEDLQMYHRSSRRRRQRQQQQQQQQQLVPRKPSPFVRSREETAALEGLVTAILSQLENIVCRVIFCPGSTDPLTTIIIPRSSTDGREKLRLTPNSRNVHQQWLPLAPSLGCGGLLYLKSPPHQIPSKSNTKNTSYQATAFHGDDEDDESDKEAEKISTVEEILSEQNISLQRR
jgi:hypothetical protein